MKTPCLILLGLMAVCGVTPLTAVTVTNLNDSGPGSLRAALAEGGNIEFAVTGVVTLTSGELVVNHPTTITGPGAEQLTIARSGAAGTPAFRVIKVLASPVTISGVTISNGLVAGADYNGAGLLNQGSLTLNDCVVQANRSTVSSARGTGLFNANDATLTANRCVVADNVGEGEYAEGSGIYVFGVVNLNNCTIRGNRGEGYYSRGGGLHVDYLGRAGVSRCTFSGNSATGLNSQGGGIYNYGRLEIVNSTLSGNHSGETGGGIHVDALAPNTAIRNCAISGNTARTTGAGLANYGFAPHSNGPRTVKDSIVAGNPPSDLENHGGLASLGHNLFGMVSGQDIVAGSGDHFNVTADALRLAPLASNGGATKTHGLLAGSLAIDAGNPTTFPDTDQRGVARPFGSRPDIGAFELDVILPALVTVTATRSDTMEAGPTVFVAPGVFTISRSGITNEPLRVFYRLSGTASNGLDYQFLSNSVVIPAGQKSTELWVVGLFDGLVEGTETVVLHLEELACPPIYPPPPECYLVGEPAEAVIRIQDYEQPANRPPVVAIFAPTDHQTFIAPANIFIAAQANDPDGYDTLLFVEFFANGESLGIRTNYPTLDPIGPFKLTWTNVPPGEYALTAKAVDDHGAITVSEPVHIFVRKTDSNQPPHVQINFPTSGTAFAAPAEIYLHAFAYDPEDGHDLTVEFFAGTNSLGLGTFVPSLCPSPYCPFFALTWSNVPPGHYVLTARATDSNATTTISEPVHVSVHGDPPMIPVVTIEAPHATASETPGHPGLIHIYRTGPTNDPLSVYWEIGGTALNGVDYATMSNLVVIPAGRSFVRVAVVPIDDDLVEGPETVSATLYHLPFAGPFPPSYVVGSPSNAVVTIQDSDPSPSPFVSISWPTNGATFTAHANIQICATASEYVATVEFFAGDTSLGIVTNSCHPPDCAYVMPPVYCVAWSDVPPGLYTLTAKATDIFGATSEAAPVHISVFPRPHPDQPVVTIAATDAHASEPGVLTVIDPGVFTVYRSGNTSAALHVQYRIEGTALNKLDYDSISNVVVIPAGETSARILIYPLHDALLEGTETVTLRLLDPFCIAIYPPPPDCYLVGAPGVATVYIADDDAPTDRPIVTIAAPDPIASEGTNCYRWPGWPAASTAGYSGTNTATFVVRRHGSTSAALTVYYDIRGTASNGADYVELPGVVTIPAGRRAAEFRIVPLDDNLHEKIETVSLRLRLPPDATNDAPPYSIGRPAHAAAIIVDNDHPRPVTRVLPDRAFHVMRPGANGTWWRIECSTDLVNWMPLSTNQITDGALHFVDPDAAELPRRFYRAMPEDDPPPE